MGATASTLAVQERFADLSKTQDLPSDDNVWDALLSAGSGGTQLTDSEFFALIPAEEIRAIRDLQPGNFRTLMVKVIERIEGLIRPGSVGTNGTVGPQINNCCRILARAFAVAYEPPKPGLPNYAVEFIWETSDTGRRCIDSLRQLLHMPGYTVPLSRPKASPQLWASGIGHPGPQDLNPQFAGARIEVVQALLSALSQPMYAATGRPGLDYWTNTTSTPVVLCSLLNYSLSHESKLLVKDPGSTLAQLALNLLMVSVVHLPKKHLNHFRRFIAKLHKREDFQLVLDGVKAHLAEDADVLWLSLIWEVVQANQKLAQSDLLVEVVQPLLEILKSSEDDNRSRLAGFALLSISAENRMCAEAMSARIFHLVWENHLVLQKPGIELATLVDILWNVAPVLAVSTVETDQLDSMVRGIEPRNEEVAEVLKRIAAIAEHQGDPGKVGWEKVEFLWDQARIQWYSAVLWGRAYQTCGRVWAHTDIKLFRVAESGRPRVTLRRPQGAVDAAGDAAMDLVKSAASKILSRARQG